MHPRALAGRMKNGAPGVRSDGVERWLRETRGLIIFEDPVLSFSLPFTGERDATQFYRNNAAAILFTFGQFARHPPSNWLRLAINCCDG